MRLGVYPCQLGEGTRAPAAYERADRLRAAPPPLRVQQRLPPAAGGGRAGHERPLAGRPAGRDRRARRPPVDARHPVPPGAEVAPEPAAPAVPRLRRVPCGRRVGASHRNGHVTEAGGCRHELASSTDRPGAGALAARTSGRAVCVAGALDLLASSPGRSAGSIQARRGSVHRGRRNGRRGRLALEHQGHARAGARESRRQPRGRRQRQRGRPAILAPPRRRRVRRHLPRGRLDERHLGS